MLPYGGTLVSRMVTEEEQERLLDEQRGAPSIMLNAWQCSDLYLLGVGAYSPLRGFMNSEVYRSVVETMHLPNGLPWTIPITLAVRDADAEGIRVGQRVLLNHCSGAAVGILDVEEKYCIDNRKEALAVYRTDDANHPGVAKLLAMGSVLLAGEVRVFGDRFSTEFAEFERTPAETRAIFDRRGWRTVAAFQTRNPVHRAHEYLQKCALEIVDGLLLHPLVGDTAATDIPASIRMKCYRVLLESYYPQHRVLLSVLPAAMRYAGPREAIFHAIVRRNYGCTHFIVGRDHAGVGNYYGSYDAQKIFNEIETDTLGIQPLFFENAFFCKTCKQMATSKTCPHSEVERVSLSGTSLRQMLREGKLPPPEFTRPEVAEILLQAAKHHEL